MYTTFKKALFYYYAVYEARFPIQRGKYQLAQVLSRVFGLAPFEVDGFKIELNPIAAIDRALILGLTHDDVVSQEIAKIPAGKAYVDVGANIGYFVLEAGKRGIPVFAFEPSPREVVRMKRNVALNSFQNINIFESGISNTTEKRDLKLGMEYNPGQNSVLDVSKSVDSVSCTFAPLSNFLTPDEIKNIGLIKIDVEGFEYEVLQGMADVSPLLSCPIVVEITPSFLAKAGHSAKDIYELFATFGYIGRSGLDESSRRYDEVFIPRA